MKIESIVLRELSMSLVHPFATSFGETRERRVLLVEVRADGLSGWGECTTGEHPYFSEESTDTAWITILQELVPLLTAAEEQTGGKCPGIFRAVRGHRMAKAAIENALWDLEAQMRRIPLYELLGGTRETIACGVSIGIQSSLEKLLAKVEEAVSQGYQRIKLKCKPGSMCKCSKQSAIDGRRYFSAAMPTPPTACAIQTTLRPSINSICS